MYNFIETFFFISLGITFILISLLVYHFKQRLTVIEQKNDTMFEIMNNMVKEMSAIKYNQAYAMAAMSSAPIQSNTTSNTCTNDVCDVNVPTVSKILVSDDDDDDYEEDTDDDDDDDDDDEDNNEDSENEDDDELEDTNIPMSISSEPMNINLECESLPMEDLAVSLEEHKEDTLDQIAESKQEDINNEEEILGDGQDEDYAKMHIKELRELAVSKGLTQDASKLKKQDILKLMRT
jgi:hypothetical protein